VAEEPALDETAAPGEAVYQSLYRRFRPQRFSEVRGQDHVTRALRNAVRDGKVAHAYLFSGPRGTGKTSTARILAMALNCAHPADGEPDGTCQSCREIRRGASMDVHELDAASNRKLDEMRDLLTRVALGTPGRWKVYIVDEVHQLTADAASALLKTLEEPPSHVVFVLATTDPQRVLPTIRSRTQHFEFRLLPADVLGELLRDVNDHAGLGVTPEAIDLVLRRGRGSARDALSVLDQVAAAAGDVDNEPTAVGDLLDALADQDAGRVLTAVAEGIAAGQDPRRLAVDLLGQLRDGFLATQARQLVLLADDAVAEAERRARRFGLPALVRAMETVGQALIDMRDSVDPRITLEVALVRLAHPTADVAPASLAERLDALERRVRELAGSTPAPSAPPGSAPRSPTPPDPTPTGGAPTGGTRSALGAHRRPRDTSPEGGSTPPDPPARSAPGVKAQPAPPGPTTSPPAQPPTRGERGQPPMPSRDDLTVAWGDSIVSNLRPPVRAYLGSGRFVGVEGGEALYALPDRPLLSRAEDVKDEAEQALSTHFGRRVVLRLCHDTGAAGVAPTAPPLEQSAARSRPPAEVIGRADGPEGYDLEDLRDAEPHVVSPEQRLFEAFPGAKEVNP
jgi:DNA polymerase III subunit gamma/tau